jgi:uncharacterized protein (DUF433 family)
MRFTRITVDPRQMGGAPCIRGLRMPVATVIGMVADGMSVDDILRDHPTLEADDLREALQYMIINIGSGEREYSFRYAARAECLKAREELHKGRVKP